MKKWIAALLAVLVPLSATPTVWAGTLPGGENESALVMVENMEDVSITETFFPDEGFRQVLKEEFDKNGDNVLSKDERNAVTALDVQKQRVASLKGIEYFPPFESAQCAAVPVDGTGSVEKHGTGSRFFEQQPAFLSHTA